MDTRGAIAILAKKQEALATDILTKLKIGSEEMASAIHKYRAMATVIDEIEKDEDADDDAKNRL